MKKIIISIGLLLAVIFVLSSCSFSSIFGSTVSNSSKYEPNTTGVWDIENSPLNGAPMNETKAVYSGDKDNEAVKLYLTVNKGTGKEGNSFTLDQLNIFTGGSEVPYVDVIMQEGSEKNGPDFGLFGYGETMPNGKMTLRGNISKLEQRSYKIKLYSRGGQWRGMTTLNLNKHLNDLSRVKNKFGYDCIEKLPDMAGFRTQFVHLYVKDTSKSNPDNEFIDYGLYTNVEQPNKDYLKSHFGNADGQMYKAENFDFSENPSLMKNVNEEGYDQNKFNQFLSVMTGNDNEKLINTIKSVNDYSQDIDEIVKKQFNRDNILTYTAFNILLGNSGYATENYIIYSPKDSKTWYFIPWDLDNILLSGIGQSKNSTPDDVFGAGMFDNNIFFRRFFAKEENLKALDEKIDKVYKIINNEFIGEQIYKYKLSVLKTIFSMPDLGNLPKDANLVDDYMDSFPLIIDNNVKLYKNNRSLPKPAYLLSADYENGQLFFKWETSDLLTYDIELAKDMAFANIVRSEKNLTTAEFSMSGIPAGTYYWRVTAKDSNGQIRNPSNIYLDEFGKRHCGFLKLTVQ